MELRQLAAFVATAEHGSFSAAARELGVVQPAVSQAVRRLEADLGLVLLTRSTRSVTLTPAGEALLEPARALTRGERALRERAREVAAGDAGILRLATTSGSAALVRDLMAGLASRRPAAQVRLHRARGATKLTALRTGELDAALVRRRPEEPGLAAVEISRRAWIAVFADGTFLPATHAILPALVRRPFIALVRPDAGVRPPRAPAELERAAAELGLKLRFGPTVSSVDELLAVVATLPAWTVLSDTMRSRVEEVGLATRPLGTVLDPARVWLAHRVPAHPLVTELLAVARTLRESPED